MKKPGSISKEKVRLSGEQRPVEALVPAKREAPRSNTESGYQRRNATVSANCRAAPLALGGPRGGVARSRWAMGSGRSGVCQTEATGAQVGAFATERSGLEGALSPSWALIAPSEQSSQSSGDQASICAVSVGRAERQQSPVSASAHSKLIVNVGACEMQKRTLPAAARAACPTRDRITRMAANDFISAERRGKVAYDCRGVQFKTLPIRRRCGCLERGRRSGRPRWGRIPGRHSL